MPAVRHFQVALAGEGREVRATVSSDVAGTVQIVLIDVLGRELDHIGLRKAEADLEVDLDLALKAIRELPAGVYFLRFSLGDRAANRKLVLVP
jgi:hypothetical protein